jgi:hypothetical protein
MVTYNKNSPWYDTPQNDLYLENMVYRKIPQDLDDAEYTVETQYANRPDLLAYDLYGDPKLWWVFVNRNRSVLKDPIFDFVPGIKIFIPRKESLFAAIM